MHMKGWMRTARPGTWRPLAPQPLLLMTARARDGFPLPTVLCHICCWEDSPPIDPRRHLSTATFTLMCQPLLFEHLYDFTTGAQQRSAWRTGAAEVWPIYCWYPVSWVQCRQESLPTREGAISGTCQSSPALLNPPWMDGSTSVRKLLSALLFLMTYYP